MISKLDDAAAIEAAFFFAVLWGTFEIQGAKAEYRLDHIIKIVGIGAVVIAVACLGLKGISIVLGEDG